MAGPRRWEIEGAPPQAGILMQVRRTDGSVLRVNRPASLGGP
jgi:hypothetical protein